MNWFQATVKYEMLVEGRVKRVSELYLLRCVSHADVEATCAEILASRMKSPDVDAIAKQSLSDVYKMNEGPLAEVEGDFYLVKVVCDFGESKTVDKHLVNAENPTQAERKVRLRLKGVLYDYEVTHADKTKLLGVYDKDNVVWVEDFKSRMDDLENQGKKQKDYNQTIIDFEAGAKKTQPDPVDIIERDPNALNAIVIRNETVSVEAEDLGNDYDPNRDSLTPIYQLPEGFPIADEEEEPEVTIDAPEGITDADTDGEPEEPTEDPEEASKLYEQSEELTAAEIQAIAERLGITTDEVKNILAERAGEDAPSVAEVLEIAAAEVAELKELNEAAATVNDTVNQLAELLTDEERLALIESLAGENLEAAFYKVNGDADALTEEEVIGRLKKLSAELVEAAALRTNASAAAETDEEIDAQVASTAEELNAQASEQPAAAYPYEGVDKQVIDMVDSLLDNDPEEQTEAEPEEQTKPEFATLADELAAGIAEVSEQLAAAPAKPKRIRDRRKKKPEATNE